LTGIWWLREVRVERGGCLKTETVLNEGGHEWEPVI
jgi:hypothetical protein